MWNQIADFAKQLFMQSQETQKNKGDIKELQKEVKELSATVQRLIYEVHRMGENEQHERERWLCALSWNCCVPGVSCRQVPRTKNKEAVETRKAPPSGRAFFFVVAVV